MPGFNIKVPGAFCPGDNAFTLGSNYDGPDNLIDTGRQHRYVLEVFEPLGGRGAEDSLLVYLNKCTRPTPEIDTITIHNGQDEIYRPGKNRWNPIEFTFYEVLKDGRYVPDLNLTASKMFEFWAFKTLSLDSSSIGAPTPGPNAYYTDVQLDLVNGVGLYVWSYSLFRCWPTKVTPRDLDYSSSDISEISVTLRFDKAYEGQKALRRD